MSHRSLRFLESLGSLRFLGSLGSLVFLLPHAHPPRTRHFPHFLPPCPRHLGFLPRGPRHLSFIPRGPRHLVGSVVADTVAFSRVVPLSTRPLALGRNSTYLE